MELHLEALEGRVLQGQLLAHVEFQLSMGDPSEEGERSQGVGLAG